MFLGRSEMTAKKWFRASIALLAAIFALGFAGCSNGSNDSPDQGPPNSNVVLSKIKIADGPEVNASSGYADTLEGITSLQELSVKTNSKTNAAVTLTPSAVFKGTIKIAKVSKDDTVDEDDLEPYAAGTTKFTFDDEDELYVKLTAQDGEAVRYYGFLVTLGSDTTLSLIQIGDDEVSLFGEPASTLAEAEEGHILMTEVQPSTGFAVTVTPTDDEATVTFGLATDNEDDWGDDSPQTIKFKDGEILGIKVVSSSTKVTNYYKIKVDLLKFMNIPYGTPSLTDSSNPGDTKYIDPLWDDITEWIEINRQNLAETDQEFFDNPTTKGKAKLYWDEDGLWLYVDVETENISTDTGYGHMGSSIELFINEAYPAVKTGNYDNIGGQYRVDTNGAVTGDPAAAVTALTTLGRKNVFTTTKGYVVIFQAPWRFLSAYPLKDKKDISLEIQINAANDAKTGRAGVLKWYNTIANTYQNAAALAPSILELNGNTLKAMPPSITNQPKSQKLPEGDTVNELSVTAESSDSGTLTYQWYSNSTDDYTGGTEVSGATSATYQPTVTAIGKYYYWVEVTNTKDGSTKNTVSNRATINIIDPDAFVEDAVFEFSPYLINTTPIIDRYQAIHKIDLGADFDISYYDRISIDMHFFDKDMTEIPSGVNSQATLKWWDASSTGIASDTYNIGASSFPLVKATIPSAVKDATEALRYLDIDSANQSQASVADADRVVFIQIRSVTFHTPD
jgi:hypothetical protein